VTDGQTDRRTELRWLRRAIAVPAVARKNAFEATCASATDDAILRSIGELTVDAQVTAVGGRRQAQIYAASVRSSVRRNPPSTAKPPPLHGRIENFQ